MTKRVMISQPMYFPWVGFIGQMNLCDLIIWLDDVQFSKGSFTNRIQIKTPNGLKWLTIPLFKKGSFQKISELSAMPNTDIAHQDIIFNAFRNSEFYNEIKDIFSTSWSHERLIDVLISSCIETLRAVGGTLPPMKFSSELAIASKGSDRVIDILNYVECTSYISGHGGKNYLNRDDFERHNIELSYMDYSVEAWPQQNGEFTKFVTSLDLLANVQPKERKRFLPEKVLRDF